MKSDQDPATDAITTTQIERVRKLSHFKTYLHSGPGDVTLVTM